MIFSVIAKQIVLDMEIVEFYEVKPIRLREELISNPVRIPANFAFQLTKQEVETMVSQNAIPSNSLLVSICHLLLPNTVLFDDSGPIMPNDISG